MIKLEPSMTLKQALTNNIILNGRMELRADYVSCYDNIRGQILIENGESSLVFIPWLFC